VTVRTEAFKQHGHRDFVFVAGEWLRGTSAADQTDMAVAAAEIDLVLYEALIDLTVPRPLREWDVETGVLRVIRGDGATTPVYVDRPGRPGFKLTGPDGQGNYRVTYVPDGLQLNPVGSTRVEFTMSDLSGQRHQQVSEIMTP